MVDVLVHFLFQAALLSYNSHCDLHDWKR